MTAAIDMFTARDTLLDDLHGELVGPSPRGTELDCAGELAFDSYQAAAGPFCQSGTGEEILTGDRPVKRYGIGVLYPIGIAAEPDPGPVTGTDEAELDAIEAGSGREEDTGELAALTAKRSRTGAGAEDDDLALSTANSFRPSSFGLSFQADLVPGSILRVRLTGGRYQEKPVLIRDTGSALAWWLREPVEIEATFDATALLARRGKVLPTDITGELPKGLVMELSAFSRPAGGGRTLLTVTAVNRSGPGKADTTSLFQARMYCSPAGAAGAAIRPYEEPDRVAADEEIGSLALLYRDVPAFAIGHGCSADWQAHEKSRSAQAVMTASLPHVEVPSTTPDIAGPDGRPIAVAMAPLAGLDASDDGQASLQAVVDGYSAWISAQELRVADLTEDHQDTARSHLRTCADVRDRMQDGVAFLTSGEDPAAAAAFRLANHAMLLQQHRNGQAARATTFNRDTKQIDVAGKPTVSTAGRGSWRPFQIAFVLAALRSTASKTDDFRDTVELIFFPTGGGKTEAYLALTAFSVFYRRLSDADDAGVDVLMRYTLRLLTAQQFQRASTLICAMDTLRRADTGSLGEAEISIGVWLGGSVTPNTRENAVGDLKKLKRQGDGENPFVLLRCPWCSAQMGPIEATGKGRGSRRADPKVAGYALRQDTVALHCPDVACAFHQALPVYVIDEDVYEKRPSLVIGTVDKFAMLAFRPAARALFGLGAGGSRQASPPNLIIQDELHLISGPLGSMVGLYETLIEELCTDRRIPHAAKPKIVGSTATIRRYQQQIHDLYCRPDTCLFPPRGLDAGDSYFASYARDADGSLRRGRIYIGVHGAGLGSIQTAQVRTFATLLQGAAGLDAELRDPWWTLLVFFNSLRELGTSLSLLQSDIPDYLRVIRKRRGLDPADMRGIWRTEELTGRLRNDEVPKAIEKLEVRHTAHGDSAVDVCLASNIVEVGVDIDRLSLMTVVGQPKTTAQYIQATGRVGRSWWERPGLVATIYGASKPRDRSHFEKFRSYHERLYAQVEPTSVTPFAPPVLDRALHAVMVAFVRQFADLEAAPFPVPEVMLQRAHDLLADRVAAIDPEESAHFEEVFASRLGQWRRWEYRDWMEDSDSEDYALLRFAGSYASKEEQELTWSVPTSLRNVDAECRAVVTKAYMLHDERGAAAV